jgi:ABC-2 type transport system permease protein
MNPSFSRLTGVELRKMVDTRAGFWLQLIVAVVTLAAIVIVCVIADPDDVSFRDLLGIGITPAAILLPIVGILLVSSEWSQRTAMTTFALVPRRPRVLAAKLLASVVLSLVALALCVAVAVVGTAVAAPGLEHTWSLPVALMGQHVVSLATGVIGGVALGAALLASAPAIVLSFVLPIAWAIVGRLAGLDAVARWLDGTYSLAPMTEHVMSAMEWARAGTTLALWMLLPLLIGLWRIVRGEIR